MSTLKEIDSCDIFARTKLLINDKFKNLQNAHVAIFGIGGVGGYVCEMCARAGVGTITIIDFDTVDITNINRQIIALNSTVGAYKTDAMHKRLIDINPNIKVNVINSCFTKDTVNEFFVSDYDYVADCIDTVDNKVALIVECKRRQIPTLSAMGAGNRINIPQFQIGDIFDTYNDGLAKVLRKKLRRENVDSAECVYSIELPCKVNNTNGNRAIGSISYYPAMCGVFMSSIIINKLLEKDYVRITK